MQILVFFWSKYLILNCHNCHASRTKTVLELTVDGYAIRVCNELRRAQKGLVENKNQMLMDA